MKYLDKYSNVWNEMNCSTMNVIDSKNFVSQLLFEDRRMEVSKFIVKELAKGSFHKWDDDKGSLLIKKTYDPL